ncbi:MAG: sodium:calcium antiporter [Woeseiaceae bacterium]|nr:sodium:calcium antiporter [Woeseiaceae bacterium]
MDFLILLLGLTGLWLGTELTIRGAVSLAARLGVSELIIGIVVLSIGSDLPELAIAIDVAIENIGMGDASDVVVGSALGSSLGQIAFVLGVAGLLAFLTLERKTVMQHGAILLGSIVILGMFAWDGYVTRTEGIALVIVYLIYLMLVISDATPEVKAETHDDSLATTLLVLVGGLVIVTVSAELTVTGAIGAATLIGVDDAVVAILIVGLGTSLPELSISVGAVLRGRHHMSVGNLIGSNIFDTLVPIGVAAMISGIHFNEEMLRLEVPFLFAVTSVVLVFFVRKFGINKHEAGVILAMYLGYAAIKIGTA